MSTPSLNEKSSIKELKEHVDVVDVDDAELQQVNIKKLIRKV